MKVFEELKQRKVLKTAALYFAVAWGATEVLSYLVERIPVFPTWADTAIAILFVLGFPVAVFLAWMFDVGKDGVRRADPSSGLGKGVIAASLAVMLLVTGALSYVLIPKIEAERGLVGAGDLGTIAILPFENLTGDPSLGYLGVGLAEDLRQRLMAQTNLKVIGRVSLAGFSGSSTDLASLRGLLDAGLLLEGSLQSIAGQLQVSVALLDTETGAQLWGNIFSAERAGWDSLRQRMVSSLAEQLALTVRVREAEFMVPEEALEAYLRGLSELNRPDVADSWFAEAIRLAPDFAEAWARRALLRVEMIWRGMSGFDAWEEAEPMFNRAREIEPGSLLADIAEAHLLWLAKLDPLASYEVLQRAEQISPNHPMVLAGLSTSFCFIGERQEDAIRYGRRYLSLDPLNPDAHNRLGLAYHFNKMLDESLEQNARAIELDPQFNRAWDYRANWQFYKNQMAEALVTLTQRAKLENPISEETKRCMIYAAGLLLPEERAIPLLEDAVKRGLGMSEAHWWCDNPLELLVRWHVGSGNDEKAKAAKRRLEEWYQKTGIDPTNLTAFFDLDANISHCETDLCRLRAQLGDEVFDAWLGSELQLHYFDFHLVVELARALLDAGQVEEGRRLAAKAAPAARDFAGPTGFVTVTSLVVALYAMAGDLDSALDYAEQVGPEAFFRFATHLNHLAGLDHAIPELMGNPRWEAFQQLGAQRLEEEVAEFDRLIASGEIVLP
jgi:TolB-like protein